MSRISLSNREGFALPMAIVAIVILTAGIAAGFAATASEYTNNAAVRGQSRAYSLAESGLEAFMVQRTDTTICKMCATDDPTTADSEWTTIHYPPYGYANIVAVRLRPEIDANTPAIYFIRSTGVDTTAKIGHALAINATRTVGVYAKWSTNTVKVLASWLSFPGLVKQGTAGIISGVDECGQKASVAGVMVPKGGYSTDGGFTPTGSPPLDTSKTYAQLKAAVPVDWAAIEGGSIQADYTIPGTGWPSAADFADTTFWPVIHVTQSTSLPIRGRGMIIADSNFSISGSDMWSGILLVGGQLVSNGNNVTYGTTMSGLNWLLGGTPPAGTIDDATANGQKSYVYDSCSVAKASQKLRHFVAMPNSWVDTVAGY
jgi:hypothetical protein